jgi:hypothetical protein
MKKILLVIGVLLMLISCRERGEVVHQPTNFIEIHGKVYKIMSVVPCEGCRDIWIMYPKDSADIQPEVINYSESSGKSTVNKTVIKVD